MSSALPSFIVASELPSSPSREEELEAIIRRQAVQLEKLQDGGYGGSTKPKEKTSDLLNDLDEQYKAMSKDIERLKKEYNDLKKALDEAQQDIHWIQDSFPKLIAEDRKRLAHLEEAPPTTPQKKQMRDGEILLALLAANGGKMLAVDARHKLGISKPAFSLLLKTLSSKINTKQYHMDRRKNVIILK